MERTEIVAHLRDALSAALDREVTELPEATLLYEDLALDSVGTLELLVRLEDTLGIEVDPEDLDLQVLHTVGTLADYVAGHLGTTAAV